ncbi:MAG: AAA family ATPase [Deltaproteobacteria bacterium]|nr:MAG: AAA family ATPase [Deltaproteobacteria bacterium]
MYASYFGFKETPFNLTPDPRYLFLSTYHREALDHLLYGINDRKGFIVITGGIGTGKTTLSRALLERLDESIKSALIFNSFISDTELLEIVNQEFGIKTGSKTKTKKEYIDRLNRFLLETFSTGGNAVLLIDEAQNLSLPVLEQIRMLSNLETEKEKLIQIVLVGQSELKELLANPSLKQLDERIMVRYELKPLDQKDVQGYVEHRLVVGGGKGNVRFTAAALKEIYKYSRGNPRRINAVCDRALLIAYAKDEFSISKRTIRKAIDDMRGGLSSEVRALYGSRRIWRLLPVLVALLVVLLGLLGWMHRGDMAKIFSGEQAVYLPVPERSEKNGALPIPKREKASVFLDEGTSLAGLFRLSEERADTNHYADGAVHVGLFPFTAEIEKYRMFRKPFRVLLEDPALDESQSTGSAEKPSSSVPSPGYLLVHEITAQGAVVVDAAGKLSPVSRDFLEINRGQKVSWVYPYENKSLTLVKGMIGPSIVKVQQTLRQIGYPVEPTGIFDDPTFQNIKKFQAYFGLKPDGIVGRRTKALLYQVSE